MSWIRRNWRVTFLVVLLLGSAVALFAPGVQGGADTGAASADKATNLQYGLELSGGVRLRATPVGMTADGVDVTTNNQQQIQADIASSLGIDPGDVKPRPGADAVEVYTNNTTASFESALEANGYEYEEVDRGVTSMTRQTIVSTIGSKIDATGFSGAEVYPIETQSGDRNHYIVVEVPGKNATEVQNLIAGRGQVEMRAYYPDNGNQTNSTVLTHEQLESAQISPPQTNRQGRPVVPIVLSDSAAQDFVDAMQEYGFTSAQGTSNCQFSEGSGYCLLTVLDGEVVYDASMGGSLAQDIESGAFQKQPSFVIEADSMSEARELQVNLQAGALPTQLEFQDSLFVSPSFAERYKPLSLVTGLFAAAAMAVVVMIRYGKPEVAVPMVFTALAEVVILLGFAAASGLALDLSHIAGFIAVIGTGVDDLVIIADEVMTEDVSSGRVFKSRFRKALWVIGAAAITTIIAMSPLAVLSLGDLRGFAIITILGVLIGVIITRPAYGDILRRLITDDR
jgi:preprotein translocase subunit SecD